MKNAEHPILKRQEQEKISLHYCPKCEMHYSFTNQQIVNHLEEHRKKFELGDDEVEY